MDAEISYYDLSVYYVIFNIKTYVSYEDVEKLECDHTIDEIVEWYNCYGKLYGSSPPKLKLLYGPAELLLNIYQDVNREDKVSKN